MKTLKDYLSELLMIPVIIGAIYLYGSSHGWAWAAGQPVTVGTVECYRGDLANGGDEANLADWLLTCPVDICVGPDAYCECEELATGDFSCWAN